MIGKKWRIRGKKWHISGIEWKKKNADEKLRIRERKKAKI